MGRLSEEFQPKEGNYIFGTSKQPDQEEREREEDAGGRNPLNNPFLPQGSPRDPDDSEGRGGRRYRLGLWNSDQSRHSASSLSQSESRRWTNAKVPDGITEEELDEQIQGIFDSEGESQQPDQEEREQEKNAGAKNASSDLLVSQGSPRDPDNLERSGVQRNHQGLGNNGQGHHSASSLSQSKSRLGAEVKVLEGTDEENFDEENQGVLESEDGAHFSRPYKYRGRTDGESTSQMQSREVKAKVQSMTRRIMASIRNRERVDRVFRQFMQLPIEAETDFEGFIQVKDPKLDKGSAEYVLTKELADSKFR